MNSSTVESMCDLKDDEDKKPTKKRKSWGQELPTPKTNLPPRKRAKTEDEKEQRRIERVLRNRQAAQSSRERKRQEVEKLEGEKHTIEEQNSLLKERLMAVEHDKFKLQQQVQRMAAELTSLRSGFSSRQTSVDSMPADLGADLLSQTQIKQEGEQRYPYSTLNTPPDSIRQCPSTSYSPTPSISSSFSRSSTPSHLGLGFHTLNTSPDMTQHPAAMLCDLQCQSGAVSAVTNQLTTANPSAPNRIIPSIQLLYTGLQSPPSSISFFEDGFASADLSDDSANVFSFDSMVDLDACGSHGLEQNVSENSDDILGNNQRLFQDDETLSANFPRQTAATSPTLQPCLGAPSSGRDGSGNAS
ncbi:MAG: hypothetical protein Q9190_006926 [Brigantiaea leucoxantha]